MAIPSGPGWEVGGPDGYSYGAVILPDAAEQAVAARLRVIRFSGWSTPPADGRLVLLGHPGAGVVAGGRRGIVEVGEVLAEATPGPVLAARVRRDRQLGLVAWVDGVEIIRYDSNPTLDHGTESDVVDAPVGAEDAPALAAAFGHPHRTEDLVALLEEELDDESAYESERLRDMLRMLGLPEWIVAAGGLPRHPPTGLSRAALTRYRVGRTPAGARVEDAVVRRFRRRRTPPPIIDEPPRATGGDEWQLWM